jgi:MFS family permease
MDKKLPKEIYNIQFLVLLSYSSLAVLTLLPRFFEHLNGSPRQIGFLIGIFSFAAFLSRPFGGWLLSRVSPYKVMLSGFVIVLSALGLHLLVQRLDWLIVFLRILHGIGFSLLIIAALLIAVLVVRQELRTYAIGVVSTGFLMPLLVMPALGEVVIERYGYVLFFLTAIFFAGVPLILSFFMKFRLPEEKADEEVASVGFFSLLRQKKILFVFLLTFIFEVGLSACLSFVPLLTHGGIPMRAGYFYTSLGLTAVFLRLGGGRWLRFWGSSKLLIPAMYFLCAGAVLTYFSKSSPMLIISGIVWGLGTGVLYPHLSALSVEGVGAKQKGKALSLFASSVDLGFALGPIIFGWLSQTLGVREAFLPLALIVFLSATGIMFWGRSFLAPHPADLEP